MRAAQDHYTLDDLQTDIHDLKELIGAIDAILHKMPYDRNGERLKELDTVNALTRIARDFSIRMGERVDADYHHIK